MIDFRTSKWLMRRHRARLWKDYQKRPEKYETKWVNNDTLLILERGGYWSYDVFERVDPNHHAYRIR